MDSRQFVIRRSLVRGRRRSTERAPGGRVRSRRWIGVVLIVAGTTLFLGLILVYPVYLQGVAKRQDRDWQTLSEVGQAYGGISAVLSGLALCGVVVSLVLQWRQTLWSRTTGARERHFELMKLTLDDPQLSYEMRHGEDVLEYRRKIVNSLWMSHWRMLWDIGDVDQQFLRSAFDELFADPQAREWWREAGPFWIARRSRRRDIFLVIAWNSFHDAEADACPASPAPTNSTEPEPEPTAHENGGEFLAPVEKSVERPSGKSVKRSAEVVD
jgi:hypothetical protein